MVKCASWRYGHVSKPASYNDAMNASRRHFLLLRGVSQMKAATTILVFLMASGIAATATSATSGADMKLNDPVRLKFAAFNKHDVDAIARIYADGATLRSPDYPSLTGNVQIADTYRKIFDAIPDAIDNLETLETSANHVYAQFVLTGHYNGAQDKPISVRIISVYTVKKGHIVEDSTYYDRKLP
jgi:ketosteroid isomerase-like protein